MATVEALMRQATEQHRAGQVAAAAALYRRVLAKAPKLADAHHLLGLAQHQQGDHVGAGRAIARAIALDPRVAPYHGNLGLVRQAAGETDAAIASFREALAVEPGYHPARLNLAAALAVAGRQAEALPELDRLMRETGPSPDLHARMAECLQRTGDLEGAAEHYRAAVRAWPDNAELQAALAGIWQLLGEEEAALAAYDAALEIRPDFRAAALNRATLLRDMGRTHDALDGYEAVLRVQPDASEAVAGKVNTYERIGEFDRAWQTLQPLLAHLATEPPVAVARAGLAGRFEDIEAALPALDSLAPRTDLPALQRQQVLFARARLRERLGRYPESLDDVVAANALTRSTFDARAHARRCAAIRTGYGARRTIQSGIESERPVFIVGMPRSGTSLVEEILASHPAVFGAGELPFLPRLTLSAPLAPNYPDRADDLSPEALAAAARQYLAQLDRLDTVAMRVSDKMPSNFLHLGLIRQMFPRARIIHIMRDAMDTCLSCLCQNFGERLTYTTNFEDLAVFYGEYLRMMAHWRTVMPEPVLELRYEDLIADSEHWIRRIIDHAGLEWDPACLAFHRSRRFVRTASYQQVRQPIYAHAVGRWRRYGSALEPLRLALAEVGAAVSE